MQDMHTGCVHIFDVLRYRKDIQSPASCGSQRVTRDFIHINFPYEHVPYKIGGHPFGFHKTAGDTLIISQHISVLG